MDNPEKDSCADAEITFRDFQRLIDKMYTPRDTARGVEGTFMWLVEEFGELAAALRDGTREQREEEFADVLAWLTTIANAVEIDLTESVMRKYGSGCPGCGQFVCACDESEKP